MKTSDYLDIEAAIPKRVLSLWSNPIPEIAGLVYDQKYDDARALAATINLGGLKIDKFVSAILMAASAYGGYMASGNVSVQSGPIFDETAAKFMNSMQHGVTTTIQVNVLNWITKLQLDPKFKFPVKKDGTPDPRDNFVKQFVSFADNTENTLKTTSSLHTSRLSTYGFTTECMYLDVDEYELAAVLDGRTSEFCRLINGKRFKVEHARTKVMEMLAATPEDAKNLQPFPKQTPEELARYAELTADELTDLGLHIPPFHPRCRTLCVRTGHVSLLPPTPTAETSVPIPVTGKKPKPSKTPTASDEPVTVDGGPLHENAKPIPKPPAAVKPIYEVAGKPATREDLQQLNVPLTPKQMDNWNASVKIKAEQALAALTGIDPLAMQQGDLGAATVKVKATSKGGLTISTTSPLSTDDASKKVQQSLTIDPIDSNLTLNYLDVYNSPAAKAFIMGLIGNTLEFAIANGLKKYTLPVNDGAAYVFGKFGLGLAETEAIKVAAQIKDKLNALYTLSPNSMTAQDYNTLSTILESHSFGDSGLQSIANYPLLIGGQPIGYYLLKDVQATGSFDLINKLSYAQSAVTYLALDSGASS